MSCKQVVKTYILFMSFNCFHYNIVIYTLTFMLLYHILFLYVGLSFTPCV